MKCPKCDGTGFVKVRTRTGLEQWVCGECTGYTTVPDAGRLSEEMVSEAIRDILARAGASGVIEEVGQAGNLRVTFSAILPPDVAEQIFDLAKEHQIR